MAVDSATTIAGFDTAKPAGSDPRTEADNNFRHVKTVLKDCFPAIAGAVTASHTELSYVDGVTSAIQTQLDAKAPIASPTLTGTPAAPTAAAGTSTTQIATTAFTQTAIAEVNATTGLTRSFTASTAFAVGAGQSIACTAATAWAAAFPASPTNGTVCAVASQNNLATNTIDLGANGVMGANGTAVSGVLTLDQVKPVYQFAWYGDYWREA
jgi:hypothetical protein